tara:strand:- start:9 stop:287 length:279 start_codon:yes stop_codon:yes gene_type:complete
MATPLIKLKDGKNKELAEWAKVILSIKGELEEVPQGWYSTEQLAKKLGFVPSGIGPHLRELVKKGKAKSKKFRTTRCKDGRVMSRKYFKLIK